MADLPGDALRAKADEGGGVMHPADATVGGLKHREDGTETPDGNRVHGAGAADATAGGLKQREVGTETPDGTVCIGRDRQMRQLMASSRARMRR